MAGVESASSISNGFNDLGHDSIVIELGNISEDSDELTEDQLSTTNTNSSGSKKPRASFTASKKLKKVRRVTNTDSTSNQPPLNELYKRSPSDVQSIRSDSSSVKRNLSAASHVKNTQQLIKDNKKLYNTKPKITVNSQFRNPPKITEYRNVGEMDECGPVCDCYYCALLNISSDDSDDEEDRFVSDDEIDSIALAYGYPPNQARKCTCRYKLNRYKKTTMTCIASEEKKYQNSMKKSIKSALAMNPDRPHGDGFINNKDPLTISDKKLMKGEDFPDKNNNSNSKGMKEEKGAGHAKNCPSRTGIVKEMPQFIREFEEAMRQAREESISDSIFDALIIMFGAIFSFFRFFWSRLVYQTPKVTPQVSTTFPKLPQ